MKIFTPFFTDKQKECFDIYIDNGTLVQKARSMAIETKKEIVEEKFLTWEYKVVEWHFDNTNYHTFEPLLNAMGKDGWELVDSRNSYIFKRAKYVKKDSK